MTRSKNKKRRVRASVLEQKDSAHSQEKINTLLTEAEAAVDSFNYDEAETKLKEALLIQPDNIKSLEMLSGIYIEKLQWKKAENLLRHCIKLEPETGYRKFFSMGQLSEGLKSIEFYEKGIQIIHKELENSENIEPSQILKGSIQRNLSEAYCSIAETFMTDCCDEDNAEEKCHLSIDLAIKYDPSNPEAYRCLADFQLVKGDIEKAKESVQKSISLWLPQFDTLTEEKNEEDAEKLEDVVPSYDSRIETSKLLIELEMYYEASNVLEGLLEEDDEVVQVWYLLGWLNYIREGNEYKGNAHYYLSKAKEVSDKLKIEDDCVMHTKELLEELTKCHPVSDDEQNNSDISDLCTESDDEEMET